MASFQDKEMASGAHLDLIDGGSRQTRFFELLQVPYPAIGMLVPRNDLTDAMSCLTNCSLPLP